MSDYVVRPKRRQKPVGSLLPAVAVDPCLGYYIPAAPKPDTSASNGQLYAPQVDTMRSWNAEVSERVIASSFDAELRLEPPLGLDVNSDRGIPSSQATTSTAPGYAADWVAFVPEPRRFHALAPDSRTYVQSTGVESMTRCTVNHTLPKDVLTVEEFLKRSSDQKPSVKRQYGKKRLRKRRVVEKVSILDTEDGLALEHPDYGTDYMKTEDSIQLRSRKITRELVSDGPSNETGSSSISYEPSSPLPTPTVTTRTSNNNKKIRGQRKPLKQRIYEAAISTYGDPDAGFMHSSTQDPDDSATRVPLRFVPGENAKEPRSQGRKKTWRLVDPRKSMAIRTASFSSRIRPHQWPLDGDRVLETEPMRKWKWDVDLGVPSLDIVVPSALRTKLGKRKRDQDAGVCSKTKVFESPLMFVSMQEAEDGYAAMFHGRGATGRKEKPAPNPSLHLEPLLDSPISRPNPMLKSQIHSLHHTKHLTANPPGLDMVEITRILRPPTSTSSEPTGRVHQLPELDLDGSPSGASPAITLELCSDSIPIPSPTRESVSFSVPPRPREVFPNACSDSVPIQSLVSEPVSCLVGLLPREISPAFIDNAPSAAESSFKGPSLLNRNFRNNRPPSNTKPLRPLASFMDEILETMRNVSAAETVAATKTRPTSKFRNRNRNNCNSIEGPIGLKMSRSPQASNGVEESTTRHPIQMDFDNQDLRPFYPASRAQMRRVPSPDILALLQTSNHQYQVILSSSP